MLRIIAPLLVCLSLCAGLQARNTQPELTFDYYFPDSAEYEESIPTPREYLGFEVGEWHLRSDQIFGYLQKLAEVSDRMVLETYAQSHEDKPLYLLHVSVPENLARLDEIRAERERSLEEPAATDNRSPLIVWLGYSVHGNEPSGANSVPLLAYHLAAGQGEAFDELLRETVILIDPIINPDGLDRFAHWANTHRGNRLVADRDHREHQEPWPSGRTNHYWFDLNRDWLPLVHPGSRGRVEKFHQWRPHLLGDFHEMGTDRTYFFQPGVPSRNNPLTPKTNYDLTAAIAEYNASALDGIGSLYYTRETFDDFYVGKGSTYPDLNGSVGILYEQASSRGHLQESIHGPVWFPFTIRNQLLASLGTLQGALEMRDDLKEYSRWFYSSTDEEAGSNGVRGYVVAASKDAVRNNEFLDLLLRHRIRVHRLGQDLEIDQRHFVGGRDFFIPSVQPQSRLVRSLFERQTSFEENVFYDISTWVIPPAFNLPYADVRAVDFSAALTGERIAQVPSLRGGVEAESSYGYVFRWDSFDAPKVLNRILEAGLRAKVATEAFSIDAGETVREFSRGTIFVPVAIQESESERIFEIIERAVEGTSVRVFPVSTGLSQSGIDLGSPSFSHLEERNVLVAVGEGVTIGAAGYIWHLLDQRVEMPVSLVESSRLGSIDLSRYNVIILPSGSHSRISRSAAGNIERWVRGGGTLIAMQRAVQWAVSRELVNVEFLSSKSENPVRLPYGEADSIERLKRISGAILSADVDETHPLGFGFEGGSIDVFRQGTLFMKPAKNPYYTPALYHENPVVSGYVSEENRSLLAGSAAVIAQPLGSGVVCLFADDLAFRGYWLGSSRMLLNAVFFGSAVRRISVSEEMEQ